MTTGSPLTDNQRDLREWRLPRGRHGLPRELVVRSQRERLLAAVVRVTAGNGYEATSVADILGEAGVGMESFYELFADKKDCLLAARGVLVDHLEETVRAAYGEPGHWVDRVRNALAATLAWFAADPAATRVVVVEVMAVGPVFREHFQSDFRRFTTLLDEGLDRAEATPHLPGATELAVGAGIARVYEAAILGHTAELPSLLPELTYELLVPFLGEDAAHVEGRRAAELATAY
jgi:AcrR family transcriptional regulator